MGLDFSRGEARWSYSGFHAFRERLAKSIGVNLNAMEGFGGSRTAEVLGSTSWDAINDPIKPLLNHSDCDGIFTPEECATVAPRLLELVSNWDADDYDRVMAERLAAGMQSCAKDNVPLEFC